MSKFIHQLNRSVDHQKYRSLSDSAVIVPKCRLSILGLLLIFSFLIFYCGLDVEDPTPPSPPVWVEKSLPEVWPERGIDAHESGGIFLEWEPSLDEDIIAYNIYRGRWYTSNDSLGDYELLERIEVASLISPEFIDRQAEKNILYSYKLKSEDRANNLSKYSDSLSYSCLSAISVNMMIPNGQSDTLLANRNLSWKNYYIIEAEDYCLTLLTLSDQLVARVLVQPRNYFGGTENWEIPVHVDLEYNRTYKWRIDIEARFVDDYETAGSESIWAIFVYGGD